MTWKEFKEKVEEQGVTDEVEIDHIDCDCSRVEVHFDEDKKSCHIW